MKSIIQEDKKCFVCGSVRDLEVHHCIHGTANRKLADRYGLWVWLCPYHHRGTEGVHGRDGHDLDQRLKEIAQEVWQAQNNGTEADFRAIFGKNYIR